MDSVDLSRETRRFHLDEDVLPGSRVNVHRLELTLRYANHGRHLVRNQAGEWLVAYISDKGVKSCTFLYVATARDARARGGEFEEPIVLIHSENPWFAGLAGQSVGLLHNVVALMDTTDRLHIIYGDEAGIHHLSAVTEVAANVASADAWSERQTLAGAGWQLGDAMFLPCGEVALYATGPDEALYEVIHTEEPTRLSERGEHPSAAIAADGTRHLAFERDRRIFYCTLPEEGAWTEPEMIAYFCSSWPSLVVGGDGTVMVAYQGEGKVDLRRQPPLYGRLRPGGGSTVSYAVKTDPGWRHEDVERSSEIVLKRRPSSSLQPAQADDPFRHHLEEFWRPSLSVDRHGVIWLYYLNSTRRHVYFRRFLGERFDAALEAQGALDSPSRTWFLQKDARLADAIGWLTVAAGQVYFDQIQVPDLDAKSGHKIRFLDNLELAECRGVEVAAGHWQKQGQLPVSQGNEPATDSLAWVEVEHGDNGFRMCYMAHSGSLRSNALPGRASSPDGVHWQVEEPDDITGMTLDGEPFPSDFWRPIYAEDPDATDPDQRYKGLLGRYTYEQGLELRTWRVVTSPDGHHWRQPALPAVVMGDISVPGHLFRDAEESDPRRRWKGVFLMGCQAGRAVVMVTSPDGLQWERTVWLRADPDLPDGPVSPYPTGPIILDPDGAENPWEEEIHDAVLWRDEGVLLAHYDAFYFHANQHVSKALAMSRDGRHFWRVCRGTLNLEHGHCGEWDSGRVRTTRPLQVDDQLWIWYCGMPANTFADPDQPEQEASAWTSPVSKQELRPWGLGLATLRLDGWTSWRLRREASCGIVTTIPFFYSGGSLLLNGSGLDELQVEVRQAANDAALPGLSADACQLSADDSVQAAVRWEGDPAWPDGWCRLCFIFSGWRAKLYAFGFHDVGSH